MQPICTERASEDRVVGRGVLGTRLLAGLPSLQPHGDGHASARGGGSLCVCSSGPMGAGLANRRRGVACEQGNVELKVLPLSWEREQSMAILASVNDLNVVVRAGFPFCVLVCHVANVMVGFRSYQTVGLLSDSQRSEFYVILNVKVARPTWP